PGDPRRDGGNRSAAGRAGARGGHREADRARSPGQAGRGDVDVRPGPRGHPPRDEGQPRGVARLPDGEAAAGGGPAGRLRARRRPAGEPRNHGDRATAGRPGPIVRQRVPAAPGRGAVGMGLPPMMPGMAEARVLYTEDEIRARVLALAEEITNDY